MGRTTKRFHFEGNKTLLGEEHDTEKAGVLEQFLNLPRR